MGTIKPKRIDIMKKIFSIFLIFLLISIPYCCQYVKSSKNIENSKINSNHSDLLIITAKNFHNECERLIDHKRDLNINAEIRTTNYIYHNYNGAHRQEKIKYCIKQAYDDLNIPFVLLIGDFRCIPVRYCYNNDEFHSLEPYFISELYYADIYDESSGFSTWNTDGDGTYGEWNGKTADDENISLIPEVSIGRLPCSNLFEFRTMIDKIIAYETELDNQDWFHRIVVAAGDTYSAARGYSDDEFKLYEGEELALEAVDILSTFEFEATTLFASGGSLSTISVIKAINEGCGFLYLSGHGSPGVWCTHPPNSAEIVGNFPNYLIPALRNKGKLPVCIVGGCQNSKFDVHPLNLFNDPFLLGTWHKEWWSWKLTSSPYGGSIATIGCTGLSWQGIEFGGGGADWLNLQFFRNYANGTLTLGSIWRNAINSYLETFPIDWNTPSGETSSIDAKTVQEWSLFGDPTIQIKN